MLLLNEQELRHAWCAINKTLDDYAKLGYDERFIFVAQLVALRDKIQEAIGEF